MEEPTLFVYEPLPAGHIRLLTPASDEVADSHSWKVQTSSLDQSDLEFDALSYVWGSDLERLDITLNGCTAQVYRNLYTALPYLARRGNLRPVRPIWIDAICINQADHEEKMMQIREMNRVYKQAKRVWIWLGISQHQESIPDAIRFLGNIAEYKKSHRHEKFDDMKKRLDLETVQIPLKVALHHIVHNEWFNRLWVIQEASLAQEPSFLCGDIECSWELLYNSLKNMRLWDFLVNEFRRCENLSGLCDHDLKDGTRKSNARGRIFFIRNVVKIHWNGENHKTAYSQAYMLALTLNMSWAHECLRPEDRVLGLLGLVDPKFLERSCLDPDIAYISVEDLFTRTTRFVLEAAVQSDKFLWEWLRCAFALHKRKGLPSWVLDFCSLWHPGFGHIEPDDSILSRYTAVKNHRITRGGLKTEQLVLKGKVVDEVMMVFRMMPSSDAIEHMSQPTKRAYLSTVAEWEKKVADEVLGRTSTCTEILPREGVEDYGMPESYWRTLINHRKCTQGEVPADDETITRDWYLDFQSMAKQLRGIATCLLTKQSNPDLESPQPKSPVADSEEILDAEYRYTNAYKFVGLMQEVDYKQLFKTKNEHLSITMSGVKPGDVLVALNGAPMLHVIRKVTPAADHEQETWKFVGDAYVHPLTYVDKEETSPENGNDDEADTEEDAQEESNADEIENEEREFVFV